MHEVDYETTFDPIRQLEMIITNWDSNQKIEIMGVILDYLNRSKKNLYNVLRMNHSLFEEIFIKGDNDSQENLLKSIIHNQTEHDELIDLCSESFPAVVTKLVTLNLFSDATESVKDTTVITNLLNGTYEKNDLIIIWQLSDIHFGRLNVIQNDFKELSSMLVHCVGMYPGIKPDYIIFTGDLTSQSKEEEYNCFKSFCSHLRNEFWDDKSSHRMIVIPGNHETTWKEDFTADNLSRFKIELGNSKYCITPFGEPHEIFEDPSVEVFRFGLDSDTCPPFASVRLINEGIQIILLVSSYFSGNVPEELRNELCNKKDGIIFKHDVINHLRNDVGFISMEYLSLLSKYLRCTEKFPIAINHHHLIQYGKEINQNPNGFALLRTLFKKGIKLLLHGHLHMFEDDEEVRSTFKDIPYSLPCTSLTSHTLSRSNGFMVHVFEKNAPNSIKTFTWELSAGGLFSDDLFRPAYESFIVGNDLRFLKARIR